LTGGNLLGENINLVEITDANGDYLFDGLKFGTYTVEEEQPPQYRDGRDTLGAVAFASLRDIATSAVFEICSRRSVCQSELTRPTTISPN